MLLKMVSPPGPRAEGLGTLTRFSIMTKVAGLDLQQPIAISDDVLYDEGRPRPHRLPSR